MTSILNIYTDGRCNIEKVSRKSQQRTFHYCLFVMYRVVAKTIQGRECKIDEVECDEEKFAFGGTIIDNKLNRLIWKGYI